MKSEGSEGKEEGGGERIGGMKKNVEWSMGSWIICCWAGPPMDPPLPPR